ncbi:hypothetical protein [Lachnospira pectinoschiza]|uniref:Uncharacterized protein n=1 Tax=Lachnospira pectinoschiza TaxID=28052 RepID=A0A1G9YUU7_9FIRM|nr:hypothetical protein [Lachnospira pectinoschiza]SDN12900.1 hypothetical protein SAMN05216544_1948 [Lachnospira pectinoschiza]
MKQVRGLYKKSFCLLLVGIIMSTFQGSYQINYVKAEESHIFTITEDTTNYEVTDVATENDYTIPNTSNSLDLSDSTKTSPVETTHFIYNNTINIQSDSSNQIYISTVTALDVEDGAVTISYNSSSDVDITFNSFFYDNVVFEITDTNSNNYYLKINRYAIVISNNFSDTSASNKYVYINLYLDKDEASNEYYALDTLIRQEYSDGSHDYTTPNYEDFYLVTAGTNVELARMKVEITDDIEDIYVLVIRERSTVGPFDTQGLITASGLGVRYNIASQTSIY